MPRHIPFGNKRFEPVCGQWCTQCARYLVAREAVLGSIVCNPLVCERETLLTIGKGIDYTFPVGYWTLHDEAIHLWISMFEVVSILNAILWGGESVSKCLPRKRNLMGENSLQGLLYLASG